MIGERLDDVTGAVLLVQQGDGKQTGWHVFNVSTARWRVAGLGLNGTRATIEVTGDFHRMNREGAPALPQIGEITDGTHD